MISKTDYIARLIATAGGWVLAATAFAAAPEDVARPSLAALVQRALEAAPAQQIADAAVDIAAAQREGGRAELLPQLSASASQLRQTMNPQTLGLGFPGLPSLIGPYSVFDARLKLSQRVFDFARHSELAGAGHALDAARAEAGHNRERIAAQVALSYIEVLAGEQAVDSARADLALAEDLLTLARDQRQAGVASGIDVARAQSATAQDRYALSEAQTAVARARLQLQRLAVLPMEQPLHLGGRLDAGAEKPPLPVAQALATAREHRAELAAVDALVQEADARLQAAKRRHWPTLSLFADYGIAASTPVRNDEETYRYGASLELPLYSGGALRADATAAEGRLEQERARAEDLRQQVEQDVRLALVTMANTAEQVTAAVAARDLAGGELELARDRFSNGVANNLDVIGAQTSLARARSQYIAALAAYQQARVNLAAAQGQAQDFSL